MTLRSYGEMAIMGLVCAALASVPLAVCRGVGAIEFVPESIPGMLLFPHAGELQNLVNWISYLASGALAGMIFRFYFGLLGQANWNFGVALGIFQWTTLGILMGVAGSKLTDSPLLLPNEPPEASAHGLLSFLALFLLNVVFGAMMGVLCRMTPKETVLASEEHPGMTAQSRKAA